MLAALVPGALVDAAKKANAAAQDVALELELVVGPDAWPDVEAGVDVGDDEPVASPGLPARSLCC